MNVQCSPIRELIIYKFKLGYKTMKATKNIYCAKVENAFDFSVLTIWFMKFRSGYKNLDDQARSSRSKTVDSVLQDMEINQARNTQRVSGEFSMSQSSHLFNISKNNQSWQIAVLFTQTLQNFRLIFVINTKKKRRERKLNRKEILNLDKVPNNTSTMTPLKIFWMIEYQLRFWTVVWNLIPWWHFILEIENIQQTLYAVR